MSDALLVVFVTVTQLLAIIGSALGAAVALAVLLGLAYTRGLLPNLRQDIAPSVKAAEEARDAALEAVRQLTVNGHASEKNTTKDDIAEVKVAIKSLSDDLTVVLHRLERVETLQIENRTELVQHLRWSNTIVPELREEIDRKQDKDGV